MLFRSLVLLACASSVASAYKHAVSPVAASRAFSGSRVATRRTAPATPQRQAGGGGVVIEAKKGKGVPIQQRGNIVAQQKMADMQQSMKPDSNGYPLFNLCVFAARH